MYTSTIVRESQPDWLTVGAHTASAVQQLRDLARVARDNEQADGNAERPWQLLGYQGYRCGRVRFGMARGWALLQLSGDLAATYLVGAVDVADSVSRLDLAVTIQTDRPDKGLGQRAYDEAVAHRATHPRASKVWHIADDDDGWTTYVGSRESDLFLRIYNKGAETRAKGDESEQRQYANSWRCELEIKGAPAQITANRLLRTDDIPGTVMQLVAAHLQGHGITPPFESDAAVRPIGTFRRRSDRDRKLDWLRKSVQPTVHWLMQHGDQVAALNALGLSMPDDA